MKIANTLSFLSLSLLAVGCADNRPVSYSVPPVYQEEVVSAPQYQPGVDEVSQGAAAATEMQNTADEDLARSVRHEFDRYGDLAGISPNINVAAHNGAVTLTGSVPGEREKEMIDAMVRNTPGVVDVHDLMRIAAPQTTYVQPTGRPDESSREYPAANTRDVFNIHVQSLTDSDRDIAEQMLAGLRNDTVLASSVPKVDIYVVNGRVTLRGIVQTEQQRLALEAAAQHAVGGGNVDDDLRVQELNR